MTSKLLTGAIAACFITASAYAKETIKIGVNLPLTGVVAASGNFVANGMKVAVEEINAKGGVLGKPLQLIIEDNKSNPTEAANVAEKLIVRNKVAVMQGAWGSTYTLAAMPKLMEYKVPMVVDIASSTKITTDGNPYVFRVAPTNLMEAQNFAPHIKTLGIKKADFLVVNNDWGINGAETFGGVLRENGVEVGQVQMMDATAQDMSSQLAVIRASDADSLFLTTSVEQATLIMKQMQSLGIKRRVITSGGAMPDQLIEQAGTAANGTYHIMLFVPWFPDATPDPEAARSFVASWKGHKYDPYGMPEGARAYVGTLTIAQAIERAGVVEPEAIRKALWETDFITIAGRIKFAKEGPEGKESGQAHPISYLVKIDDGKVQLVEEP
ncbi:ABC transporter substrate-binding protein [Pusillimonas sp.]|uniref:ABC transporter substrate-binding protein n=1 Tax=Pusillimonas sp. TaxID=3040095 RepID=UPI0037C9DCA0